MDIGIVGQKTFRVSVIEVRSVVDRCLFRWRAAEDLGSPGVAVEIVNEAGRKEGFLGDLQVAVEMNDGDGSVSAIDATEEGEGDGVVSSERDDSWQGFSFDGWTCSVCVGCWLPSQNFIVAFLNLLNGIGVVIAICMLDLFNASSLRGSRSHRNITAVYYLGPAVEGIGV